MQYCNYYLRYSKEIPFFALKLYERKLSEFAFIKRHFFLV